MLNFINKSLLTSEQLGFTTNISTEQGKITIYEKFLDNLENKQYTCTKFLDSKKAFHVIDHQILLKNFKHYNVRGKFLNIFKSYQENRKMSTIMYIFKSQLCKIAHGIPQGSVLSPLFFYYVLMIYRW